MKGFVFIFGSEIILRFLSVGAFKDLDRNYDLTFVALNSDDLMTEANLTASLGKGEYTLAPISHYPERFANWNELFNLSCILYEEKSPSFTIRHRELAAMAPNHFAYLKQVATHRYYKEKRERVEQEMGLHPDILALVQKERPDFFVLPSSLLDYLTEDVLQIAEAFSIPVLMLVLGWDNLSSKGLLYRHPKMMGVWGEQSKRHAIEVQDMDQQCVRVIGAPHFDGLHAADNVDIQKARLSLNMPPGKRVILFGGSLRPFDETAALQKIDDAISTGDLEPLHVIYRPHPWRQIRDKEKNFFECRFNHVTMDPESSATYRREKDPNRQAKSQVFLFQLAHLSRLYHSVDAVICPMSTLLLESMSFGLPTLAIAFGDGKHSWSAHKVSRMLHFKEFYDVHGVIICREKTDFFPCMKRLLTQIDDKVLRESFREKSQEFVYRDNTSYSEKVRGLTRAMLDLQALPPNVEQTT